MKKLYCTYCTHHKITCASRTSTTICTARTVIATIFYSWVRNVYEEMYCTYYTHHKITCASRTSTTIWTRLRRYGQHNIYCAHYKIIWASRTSTTICTCRVLTTEFYLWVRTSMTTCTHSTHWKILRVPERQWRHVARKICSMYSTRFKFTCESGTSMTTCFEKPIQHGEISE